MSASKRKKAGRTEFAARIEALRASGFGVSHTGRTVAPGTREYEKALEEVARALSQEQFEELTRAKRS